MSDLYDGLMRHGFRAGGSRLKALLRVLEHNEFSCLEDLAGATDMDKLEGFEVLPGENIEFIGRVVDVETRRFKEK